ncbi:HIT family protein [Texcoconibacillus texcoconensis]|uniref:Histidine triad (HIT) family protein n=1 Tax=Texcoconibacillus texcoconensis TaxID=1095777 RepID=A0A840QPD1_9BACI|nr:HIT family protein [Texcoconibacillus texcoconensis]MBB5173234.1 histidine triad (HIT) family protein [Texcoconibacillus texcoconensis]
MSQTDCVFCKIIKGDIPSAKVYENEHVYAFLDISQVTKGHTLVIPKNHHEDIYSLPKEEAKEVFSVVPEITNAIQSTYQPIGLNILNNNGEKAGQSVFHYHLHLLPRYGEGDGFGAVWKEHGREYSPEDLQNMASAISNHLS